MSERKIPSRYFRNTIDSASLSRGKRPPREADPQPPEYVRLTLPFTICCTNCGEFSTRGQEFNARKETTDEKYYNIPIFRFCLACPRCSAEMSFKTDPNSMSFIIERGAERRSEPWQQVSMASMPKEEDRDPYGRYE